MTFEDLITNRYMTMVHSITKKPDVTEILERVYLFKNTLNTLSYDIDQNSYKLMNFEKELKRVRFH